MGFFSLTKPDKTIVKQIINPCCNTPVHCILEIFNFFARENSTPPKNREKSLGRLVQIDQLVEVTELQNAAGETRYICYFGPLSINEKLLADQTDRA